MKDEEILANAPKGNFKSVKILGDRHVVWVPENYRSLADIKTIVDQQKLITKLEKIIELELEKQLLPDLFWDANNTETSFESLDELMQDRFEDGSEAGDVVEIQRAALLQNETYVFTKIDDDYSFEYELQESSK